MSTDAVPPSSSDSDETPTPTPPKPPTPPECFICRDGIADTQLCNQCYFHLCKACATDLVIMSQGKLIFPCPNCRGLTILPRSNVLTRSLSSLRRLLERATTTSMPQLMARAQAH